VKTCYVEVFKNNNNNTETF